MKTALFISLILLPLLAHAEGFTSYKAPNENPTHELWLASGFVSYHFQSDQHLRNDNAGMGLEYRYSSNSAIAAGSFNNSDWQTTRYLAWQYQPVKLGIARLGAVVGLFDGYPKVNNSGWFIAVIPAVSVEYKRLGANMAVVPTFKDKLHGAVSLQIKFKLF